MAEERLESGTRTREDLGDHALVLPRAGRATAHPATNATLGLVCAYRGWPGTNRACICGSLCSVSESECAVHGDVKRGDGCQR